MALDDDIRTLSGVALFQSLDREHLRLLAFGADKVDVPAGQRLYREGDVAETAFILISGSIGLYRMRENDREQVGTVQPGAILSEFALIAESQRLTEAVAVRDSQLLRIDRKSFMRVLEEYPQLASILYDRIAEDLQAMIRRIDSLSSHFNN